MNQTRLPIRYRVLQVKAKRYIAAIQQHGSVSKAAEAEGVDRKTIARTVKKAQLLRVI